MRILRVAGDHYVAESVEQLERYALVLLNQRLTVGALPPRMVAFARTVCSDEDGPTAFALLQRVEPDVQIIPAKVL